MISFGKITAFTVSMIIIFIAFAFFVIYLVNVSVQNDFQEISTNHVKKEIEINSNFYGIPYINASNEEDLFFATGYYQASMRLWQMDYYRRLAGGRLSEIFGKETVKIDKFMRCFDIESIAQSNYKSISGKSKTILDAYSRGVNYYIEKNHSGLSFEFNALNYKPGKWKPYHSLMIGKFLTFELSLSIWADITFGEIFDKLGSEKVKLFLPNEDYNTITYKVPSKQTVIKKNISFYNQELFDIKAKLGIGGSSSGSNCWTFRNTDSTGLSNSILANDAHLLLGAPARWMQMRLTTPEIDVIGMTIPGIPLILSGRNKNIAWGITNVMVDGFDYFIEKLDKKQENYYTNDSLLSKLTYVLDTINISGDSPEIYYKRKTANSYLISDFHILSDSKLFLKFESKDKLKGFQERNNLSFKWIGNYNDDDIYSLYKINKSRNYEEFKDATRHWASPGLNFHYCDKSGNMGVISAGFIPLRNPSCNPNLPNPAWIKDYSWRGVTKLSDSIFSVYNPQEKFLATANNKLSLRNDIFISDHWEPDSRVMRISELLTESVVFTNRDAQYLQNDFLSLYAKEIINICLPVLKTYNNLLTDEEKDNIKLLQDWDYILSRASVNASFYTMFYENLVKNTFFDELGSRIYKQYSFISSLPTRKILSLLKMPDSELFDIQGTKNIENKEFIIFKSYRDALVQFNDYFGNIPLANRTYGKMHTLTLEHPLSKSKFLKPAVTLGPFETGGNNTTINNGEWNLTNPYKQVIGASMRIICDMNSNFVYTSLPGGISGDPMHPNYSDQLQIWLNGGYVKLPFTYSKNNEGFRTVLRFTPD